MPMRLMKAIAFALVLWCVASAAHAKCAYGRYTVEGRLLLPRGVPAERVRVYLLVDGMTRASDYPATASEPDFETPDTDGHFRVESWVSTASGDPNSVREQCKRVEAGGEIFVAGDGIYARRVRVTFTPSRREILKKLKASAQVDPVEIEQLPQQ